MMQTGPGRDRPSQDAKQQSPIRHVQRAPAQEVSVNRRHRDISSVLTSIGLVALGAIAGVAGTVAYFLHAIR